MAGNLVIKSFGVAIEVSIHDHVVVAGRRDISSLEKFFAELGEATLHLPRKADYERCRAILKWAATCKASWVDSVTRPNVYGHYHNAIEFTFGFQDHDMMTKFVDELRKNVKF